MELQQELAQASGQILPHPERGQVRHDRGNPLVDNPVSQPLPASYFQPTSWELHFLDTTLLNTCVANVLKVTGSNDESTSVSECKKITIRVYLNSPLPTLCIFNHHLPFRLNTLKLTFKSVLKQQVSVFSSSSSSSITVVCIQITPRFFQKVTDRQRIRCCQLPVRPDRRNFNHTFFSWVNLNRNTGYFTIQSF